MISVAQAIEVRATGSSEEMAVAGWFQTPPAMFCAFEPAADVPLLQVRCGLATLMQAPESLLEVVGAETTYRQPTGPAFNVVFAGPAAPEPHPLPATGRSRPVGVTFVGHFDDRRAALCPPQDRADCRARFVVDAVAWVDGVTRAVETNDRRNSSEPHPTPPDDPADRIRPFAPTAVPLNIVVLPGSRVASLEPALRESDVGIATSASVWVVTALEAATADGSALPNAARVRTFVIAVDGRILEAVGGRFLTLVVGSRVRG